MNTPSTMIAAAFYHFATLPDFADKRAPLLALCEQHNVYGTVLLAAEGVNGTIAGEPGGVRAVLQFLRSDPRLASLEHKESPAARQPFHRMKVRLKREIVTLGVPELDPASQAGTYVEPSDWNALIADPDVVLVDTRNDYEVAIGTFPGALNPATQTFREFPEWLEQHPELRGKKVAMFCTGGIRCEKSTALLRSRGFDAVYHLKGGILKYLETVPAEENRWQGECFVFDERVSVGHGLAPGSHTLCRSCRHPLSAEDRASPLFEEGVSCARCHHTLDDERRAALAERQRQSVLAEQRGQRHVGARVATSRQH
ncbi:rhodanese-related sulfurtransferase [Xanthomonadaceae bacterium JHOS43]|nr:rhodanese-related sulfurtransferase [Xanthomonadaceae bacterium JHOS43]MCX7564022.1 rhodanese-related sulfurtransferase [Xanthomonadaceae bacterium XH05]